MVRPRALVRVIGGLVDWHWTPIVAGMAWGLCAIGFFILQSQLSAAGIAYQHTSKALGRNWLLVGGELRLPEAFWSLHAVGMRMAQPGGRWLLIAASARCGACQADAPHWVDLVTQLTRINQPPITLLTLDEPRAFDALLPALRRGAIPFRIVKASNSNALSMGTGIRSTPTVAVLDADNTVLLVTQRLTPAARAAILSAFAANDKGGV
jgi:hypothetical protein